MLTVSQYDRTPAVTQPSLSVESEFREGQTKLWFRVLESDEEHGGKRREERVLGDNETSCGD